MIYLHMADGRHLLILEPENIEKMKEGKPLVSPNHDIMIAYTPDAVWTEEQLKEEFAKGNKFNPVKLDEVLKEGLKRPEVHRPVRVYGQHRNE